MSRRALHRDYETRSTVDLKKAGAHVYFEDPSTDVWCCAYAVDDGEVKLWTPGDPVPAEFIECANNHDWLAYAHNDGFERLCEKHIMKPRYGFPEIPIERHRCTLAMGYAMALPGALEHITGALGINEQKDMDGRRVMLSLSRPRKSRKGEDPTKLYWRDEPEKLQKLYAYNKQDIHSERGACSRLVHLRPTEQRLWELDARINDRGVPVDEKLCRKALAVVEAHTKTLDAEMANLTEWEVTACSNVGQLKGFLQRRGIELGVKLNKKTMEFTPTLDKEAVGELLGRSDLDPAVRRALDLRQEAGKASVSKIEALLAGRSADGRARGLTQFHAASTGRWGGRRFQPQNIIRPDEDFDIDGAIDVMLRQPTERALRTLDTLYGPPLTCVSYTLRGMVAPVKGRKIVAADFSGIESRVLAWLAGEEWKLKYYRDFDAGVEKNDIYKVTASGVFGVLGRPKPPEAVTKDERQTYGKVPELACGYQGGVGAFQTMAHTYGVKITDTEADTIKSAWREKHPRTKQFWYDLDEAGLRAIANPGKVVQCGPVAFRVVGSFLWLRLPSGRALCYPYPAIRTIMMPWGEPKDAITFKTVPNTSNFRKIVPDDSNTSKWARIATYGGALAENVVQAAARDVLAEAMFRLEANNYPIILHVHDEAVSEVDEGFGSAEEYEQIMTEPAPWMAGLPIAASGFEAERYRK